MINTLVVRVPEKQYLVWYFSWIFEPFDRGFGHTYPKEHLFLEGQWADDRSFKREWFFCRFYAMPLEDDIPGVLTCKAIACPQSEQYLCNSAASAKTLSATKFVLNESRLIAIS
jgi:hypothetical protein